MTVNSAKHRTATGKRAARIGLLPSLSVKQIKFINEYMVDRNGKKAAMRAGYSEASASHAGVKMMANPLVVEEIERRDRERAERCGVKVDDILLELKRMAFFDVRRLFNPANGKLITDPSKLTEDEARALVNFDIIVLDKQGNYVVKLNPGNKMRALELLGKHLKMFTDKVEVNGVTVNYEADFGDGASD